MPKLIFLGSSNSIPDINHENSHMVIVGEDRTILIDCVSSPTLRLEQAGVEPKNLTDLILTHFHPDHVSGVPLLLMNMWLMGHVQPLRIYGLHHTLDRVENMMGLYSWSEWPNFFPVVFFRLPAQELTTVLEDQSMHVIASPVRHMVPAIGLRVDFKQSGKSLAYSCDTEPCEQVVKLATGVDVLIHEASGALLGHSSAAQAGEIAQQAKVASLYLIHYPTGQYSASILINEAKKCYRGPIALAEDYLTIDF